MDHAEQIKKWFYETGINFVIHLIVNFLQTSCAFLLILLLTLDKWIPVEETVSFFGLAA